MSTFARIPALDGVRGFAALMVLFCHFWFWDVWKDRWWFEVAHSGWLGVDLFFVLSGFLITGILLDSKAKPRYFYNFYRRRIFRIFPLYYLGVFLALFAVLVIDRQPSRAVDGYNSLVWYLTFTPNVAIALGGWTWQTSWVILSHLWSVAVEEQFYIVWPLLVLVLPRRGLAFLCGLLIFASYFLRVWTDDLFQEKWSEASYVLPYCRMDGLAAGSLLAVSARLGWLTFSGWQREIARDFAYIMGMTTFYLLIAGNSHLRGTTAALTFAGVIFLALTPGSHVQRWGQAAWLQHLGKYSYALYVFHQMFIVEYWDLFRYPLASLGLSLPVVQAIYHPLAFAATYGLARLSWRFIEKPILDRK